MDFCADGRNPVLVAHPVQLHHHRENGQLLNDGFHQRLYFGGHHVGRHHVGQHHHRHHVGKYYHRHDVGQHHHRHHVGYYNFGYYHDGHHDLSRPFSAYNY